MASARGWLLGAAIVVVGGVIAAAVWLLGDAGTRADSEITLPQSNAPAPAGAGAPVPETVPPVDPTPRAPSLADLVAWSVSGSVTFETLLGGLQATASALNGEDVESLELRDGGIQLAATRADGTEVVYSLTASAAPQHRRSRPTAADIPDTLPWTEALETLPVQRPAPAPAPLDTVALTLNLPADTPPPAPWTALRASQSLRLSITRDAEGQLSGHVEGVLTPLPSPELEQALRAASPPGRLRTGTRYEWSSETSLRARVVHAASEQGRTIPYRLDTTTHPELPRPELIRSAARALFEVGETARASR